MVFGQNIWIIIIINFLKIYSNHPNMKKTVILLKNFLCLCLAQRNNILCKSNKLGCINVSLICFKLCTPNINNAYFWISWIQVENDIFNILSSSVTAWITSG